MKKRQLKLSQNKKDQKMFQVHRFRCHFFTAGSWEKDSKNDAPGICFGPSYFETALAIVLLHQATVQIGRKF